MVIVATVLGLAAPSLRGFFGSRQTDDVARRLVALARLARSLAASKGRTYRLNLDVQEGTYWLTRQDGGTFLGLGSEFGRTFSLPEGIEARWEEPAGAASRGYVVFHPDGRAEAVTIRITGRQGQQIDVTCRSPVERFQVARTEETYR